MNLSEKIRRECSEMVVRLKSGGKNKTGRSWKSEYGGMGEDHI